MPSNTIWTSCDSHPNRTELDCYKCGFAQADYYKQKLDDFKERFSAFLRQESEAWEHIDQVRDYIEALIERVEVWWH